MTPETLNARVRRSGECLEWTGPRNANGYGRTSRRYVHRMAWEFEVGPIPTGLQVLHHCDNPPCVRIEHLFLGTISDNMRDAAAKGRLACHNGGKGPRHYAAKVTTETAASMQRGFDAGFSKAALARHFGVGSSTVKRVIAGNHWTAA